MHHSKSRRRSRDLVAAKRNRLRVFRASIGRIRWQTVNAGATVTTTKSRRERCGLVVVGANAAKSAASLMIKNESLVEGT
jgi:hypothetical protein